MTVRIEAGSIKDYDDKFMRWIEITNGQISMFSKAIFAKTRDELEIIDHENFRKE